MNMLENHIIEIYSEKEIDHKKLGKMVEVSMKTSCYGREDVNKQWFGIDEWKKVKEQGYYRG